MPKSSEKLVLISGEPSASSATIVVGGIHDTYEHFKSWEADLGGDDRMLMGFDHDHQSSTMTEAGQNLANEIRDLQEQGVENIEVVAHSMGGLVAKAAINDLIESGDLQKFESVDFHALGTPWGGFALAGLPGSATFGPMIGYPMAGEMAPGSEFMENLSSKELPSNTSFTVYQGSADNISLPSVLDTHNRYDQNTAAAEFVVVEGAEHSDYVKSGAQVLETPGRDIDPTFEGSTQVAEASPEMDTPDAQAQDRDASQDEQAPEMAPEETMPTKSLGDAMIEAAAGLGSADEQVVHMEVEQASAAAQEAEAAMEM